MNNKGFTIIEVLVTLIILSMIAIITSNILQSSLESEKESTQRLNSIKELNLASSILRRDIRQIANVSIKDFYGNKMYGTFISELNSDNLMFTTKVKSFSNEVSPLKRVQYVVEDVVKVSRKERIQQIIFEADTPSGKFFDIALLIAILTSILTVSLESVDSIDKAYHTELRLIAHR